MIYLILEYILYSILCIIIFKIGYSTGHKEVREIKNNKITKDQINVVVRHGTDCYDCDHKYKRPIPDPCDRCSFRYFFEATDEFVEKMNAELDKIREAKNES